MNKKLRKRKIKALMKLASDPSSSELTEFEDKVKTYDYGDSSFQKEISNFVDRAVPATPFGIAMTSLLALLPKGHTPQKDKAIHGDYIMPNLGIFESFEDFSEATFKVTNSVSKIMIESFPGIGEAVEVDQLVADIFEMTNNFLWGNKSRAKEDAKDVVLGAGLLFIPEVLEWIGKGLRGVYSRLIKKEYPELSASQVDKVVEEIPVDEIQMEINRHYQSEKMNNPKEFIDNAFNHSLEINIPYHSVKHKKYFDTFEDQIIDTITIVDEGIKRNFYIIKNPDPPGGKSLYYVSSGTSQSATASGQVSRIEGVEPYFADANSGGWYAKSYAAKFPQPGTVDQQIVKRLEELDPIMMGQKKYHIKTKQFEDKQIEYIEYQTKHLRQIQKIEKNIEALDPDDVNREYFNLSKEWHLKKLKDKNLEMERLGDSEMVNQMNQQIRDNIKTKYFDENPYAIKDVLKEHGYDQGTSPIFDNRFKGSVYQKAPIQQALAYARFGLIRLSPTPLLGRASSSINSIRKLKTNPQDLKIEFKRIIELAPRLNSKREQFYDPRKRELLNRYFKILDKIDYKNPAISGNQYIDILEIKKSQDDLFPFANHTRKKHIEIIDSIIYETKMTAEELHKFCKKWKSKNPGKLCPYNNLLSKIFNQK